VDFQSAFASAVDSMFSAPAAAPAAAPEAPAAAPVSSGDATPAPAAEAPATPAAPVEAAAVAPVAAPEATPAKSATDYALELAKVRAKEKALADDKAKTAKDAASQADALKRLSEIEAVKDNPLKLLELFKLDYKRVTDDYVKQLEADPQAVDPVLKKLGRFRSQAAGSRCTGPAHGRANVRRQLGRRRSQGARSEPRHIRVRRQVRRGWHRLRARDC
jgi:hypothetical protein